MTGKQALELLTAGALGVFATRAATAIAGGRGGLITEVLGASVGIWLASKLK